MEFKHPELFHSFLEKHLKDQSFDNDAYLEKLIIHWGETGALFFTLDATETVSGKPESIAYTVETQYFIRQGREKVFIEDLDEGYDGYVSVLCFSTDHASAPVEIPAERQVNPMGLIRHRTGMTLQYVADFTGIDPDILRAYEKPSFHLEELPLHTAASIAKALRVHAEDLLSCAPTAPVGH